MFYSTSGEFEDKNNLIIEKFTSNKTCGFKTKQDVPYGVNIGSENIINWEFRHAFSIKKIKSNYTGKDYIRVEFRQKILDGLKQSPSIRRFELDSNILSIDVFTIAVGGGAGGGEKKFDKDKQGKGGGGGGVVFGNLSFSNNKTYVVLPGIGGLFNKPGEDTEIYDSSSPEVAVVKAGGGGKSDGLDKGGTCFVVDKIKNNFKDLSIITNNTQQGASFRKSDRKFNGKDDNQTLNCETFSEVILNDFNGILCKFDGEKYSGGGNSGVLSYVLKNTGDYCWNEEGCNNQIKKNIGRGGTGRGCSELKAVNKGVDGAVILFIDFDNILLSGQSIKKNEKKDELNVPEKWKTWIPNEIKNRYFITNNYFEDVKEKVEQEKDGKKTIEFASVNGFPTKFKSLDLSDVNRGTDFDGKLKLSQNILTGWETEGKKVFLYTDSNEINSDGSLNPFSTKGGNYIGLKREDSSIYPSIKTFVEGLKKGWPYTLFINCRKDPKCDKTDNKLRVELFYTGTTKKKTYDFTIPDDDNWMVKPFYFECESSKIEIKLSNITNYESSLYCENYSQIYIDNIELVKEKINIPSKIKSVDCKGKWNKCDKNCIKKWILEQPAEGPNGKCNNVENQIEVCKPGEDECPLDKNCSGKWGLCDQNCLQTWRLDRNGGATGKGTCGFVDGMQRKCYSGGLCNKYNENENETVCEKCPSIESYIITMIVGLVIGYLINFAIFKNIIFQTE